MKAVYSGHERQGSYFTLVGSDNIRRLVSLIDRVLVDQWDTKSWYRDLKRLVTRVPPRGGGVIFIWCLLCNVRYDFDDPRHIPFLKAMHPIIVQPLLDVFEVLAGDAGVGMHPKMENASIKPPKGAIRLIDKSFDAQLEILRNLAR